jgi:hypothetical protein
MSFKVMTEELKANNSMHQQRVSMSMVFILRVQVGTRTKRDLKNLNLKSFTTPSLSFMFLQYLLLLVTINQDKVEVTRQKQSLLTWKRLHTHALFTSTHSETIDI